MQNFLMPEDYISMPRQKLDRIEIYLSPDSPDDLMLLEIWKTLSNSGRGRGQSFFRHALLRGIRTMKYPDTPDAILGLINKEYTIPTKKRGPKKTWKPSKKQNETIDIPGTKTQPTENKVKPDIPIDIIKDYEQSIKEQKPTPETLGFAETNTITNTINNNSEQKDDIIKPKKKSRLGDLM